MKIVAAKKLLKANDRLAAENREKLAAAGVYCVNIVGSPGAGIAGGAEAICIPEIETKPEEIAQTLIDAKQRGKSHGLVVVAEGAKFGAPELLAYFKENKKQIGFDLRATQLGHVQRGGAPTAFDRTLATRLGSYAVKCMVEGKSGVVAGLIGSKLTATPHTEVIGRTKSISPEMYELAGIMTM